jgi:hypothetical protein
MSKVLSNRKITLATGVLIAYQVFLGSLAAFGIIRVSIGLIQGDFDSTSFGVYQ